MRVVIDGFDLIDLRQKRWIGRRFGGKGGGQKEYQSQYFSNEVRHVGEIVIAEQNKNNHPADKMRIEGTMKNKLIAFTFLALAAVLFAGCAGTTETTTTTRTREQSSMYAR